MIINIRNHKLLFAPQSDSLPPPYRCQTIKTHKNVQVKNHLSAYKYCLCERQQLTGRYVDNFIGHLFYCLLQIYDSVRPLLGRKKGIAGHFPPSLQLGKSEQLKISGCITFQLQGHNPALAINISNEIATFNGDQPMSLTKNE